MNFELCIPLASESSIEMLLFAYLLPVSLNLLCFSVLSKIYDKRDDFDFDIVNFPFKDGDVPSRPSYGVYISLSS